jgi:hypothetical protein
MYCPFPQTFFLNPRRMFKEENLCVTSRLRLEADWKAMKHLLRRWEGRKEHAPLMKKARNLGGMFKCFDCYIDY